MKAPVSNRLVRWSRWLLAIVRDGPAAQRRRRLARKLLAEMDAEGTAVSRRLPRTKTER